METDSGSAAAEAAKLNYFNYFTEIEETFVRRRGKNLLLSPIDWALMETWQERGIPLHIALRAIENVFDVFDRNPGPRTIKGLMFCREEVEAQFEEWAKGKAGASDVAGPAAAEAEPFSKEYVEGHLDALVAAMKLVTDPRLTEEIERVCVRLAEIRANLDQNLGRVDDSLRGVEEVLNEALLNRFEPKKVEAFRREVEAQFAPHKKSMPKDSFESTVRLLILKRIREEAGIPRLSLFFV